VLIQYLIIRRKSNEHARSDVDCSSFLFQCLVVCDSLEMYLRVVKTDSPASHDPGASEDYLLNRSTRLEKGEKIQRRYILAF